jgi:uncharacterized membrane-anchored protein YhcB (DUF1043 family)
MGGIYSGIYNAAGLGRILFRISNRRMVYMNWQELIVFTIVGICAGMLLYRLFCSFRKTKQKDNYCINCSCGHCDRKKIEKKKSPNTPAD